ncbi:hypothetical protein PAXRUDRAFT_36218 [Paxillus rubicundulus Ve08.2h10]|uniref:CHAT domain-containing protein n=1 Tax=Paxillus rubicundulus Ve08.2h10 TaxID=930991 RepID=A0A0D0CXN1_9AGAM|nr:hypothetical protein PAXRUDRAFT_36218 [Paxillus rubicundulus Ve08.2h10]
MTSSVFFPDVEEALQLCHIVKAEIPPAHPVQVCLSCALAPVHLHLYELQHEQDHLHNAMNYFNTAITFASSNLLECLQSSVSWIQHAEHYQHPSTLNAYAQSLEFLDFRLSATASVSACHHVRLTFPTNFSFLEQVQTMLWSQMAQFHTQLTQLDSQDPHVGTLIQRFQHLGSMPNQTFKGFSWFLLPPLFSVIVLTSSEFSCDAVIVLHKQSSIHIHLETTLETLITLVKYYICHQREKYPNGMMKVLRDLWAIVISPVVIELDKIWSKHFYVSSYTPSLSALIKACQMRDSSSSISAHFAAIVQAKPTGHETALFYPHQEAGMTEHLLSPFHPAVFTKLTTAMSAKEAGLDGLQKNHSQDFVEPFKSSLKMLDGLFSLPDIIHSMLSDHEFVYLSACQTAVGDIKTPNEMISFTAGLHFGGVTSVIRT